MGGHFGIEEFPLMIDFDRGLLAQMADHPGWRLFAQKVEGLIALDEGFCRTNLIKSNEDAAKTNMHVGRIQAFREVLQIPDNST